ncbi:MAG TPA: hypothetical protein VD886_24230 [Herpetosiphonaceae bacterium]|nr:hypothetical protein [Herpetosiphonaceae bacterium]
MQLVLEDGSTWHFPNPSAIRNALAQVDGVNNSFLILDRDETHFMQAARDPGTDFVVEYRDGDGAHHYQARGTLGFEAAAALFEGYAAGSGDWRGAVEWTLI